MKISIVTATYNRINTVADAVHSLHRQSYENYEHVIQDGGSTDGTLDILKSLETRNSKIVSAPDKGIYDALNKGIARATGDVIGLMHSDDFFASDTVLEQVAAAFEDQAIDGVYGDLQYVSATDTTHIVRHWRAGHYTPKALARGWMPPHPTLYLRQDVFTRWGAYDTGYQISADYDAMLRWLLRGQIKLAYIPDVLVKMRVGGESNRSMGRILQKSREDYRVIKANGIGGFSTLFFKNARKIGQFIQKG